MVDARPGAFCPGDPLSRMACAVRTGAWLAERRVYLGVALEKAAHSRGNTQPFRLLLDLFGRRIFVRLRNSSMSVSFGPLASVDGVVVSANERVCAANNYVSGKELKKELAKILLKTHPDKARNKVLSEEVTKELNSQRNALRDKETSDCNGVPARRRPAIEAALAAEMAELSMSEDDLRSAAARAAEAQRAAKAEAEARRAEEAQRAAAAEALRAANEQRRRAAEAAEARRRAADPEERRAEERRKTEAWLRAELRAEDLRKKMNIEHAWKGHTPAQFARLYPLFERYYGEQAVWPDNNTPYGKEAQRAAKADAEARRAAESQRAAEALRAAQEDVARRAAEARRTAQEAAARRAEEAQRAAQAEVEARRAAEARREAQLAAAERRRREQERAYERSVAEQQRTEAEARRAAGSLEEQRRLFEAFEAEAQRRRYEELQAEARRGSPARREEVFVEAVFEAPTKSDEELARELQAREEQQVRDEEFASELQRWLDGGGD